MIRLRTVLLACAVVPFAAYAGPVHALTLKEALSTAYATNPQIEVARANLRATDEEVAKANAGWRPRFNFDGTAGTQHIITDEPTFSESDRNLVNGRAVLSEPLYRGGRTVADIRRANALVRAARAQLVDAEQRVLLDAVTAYMDVVRDTANLDYRRTNVRVLQDQLDASNTQLNAGAITQTDVQQTQARLAVAQAGAASAEGQLASSRARFERVIGRPAESLEMMPALPPLPGTMDEAVSRAVGTAPALLAARENSRAADYAIDQAISGMGPQVTLSLQYQYAKNSTVIGVLSPGVTQREASVFVQVTMPLYQGGAEYAQIRQAKELRSQSLATVSDVDRQVREIAQSAYGNFVAAQSSIASNELAVQANQAAVMGVLQEQRAGERSILDILNAQQELLAGEIGLSTARRDATVAAFSLLAATGQLTANSLSLDGPLYDPLDYYNRNSRSWFGLGSLPHPLPQPIAAPAETRSENLAPSPAAQAETELPLAGAPASDPQISAVAAQPAIDTAVAASAATLPAALRAETRDPSAMASPVRNDEPPAPMTAAAKQAAPNGPVYYVQAGAYFSETRARIAMSGLDGLGARVMSSESDGRAVYRVRIGPFASLQEAKATAAQAQSRGHSDLAIVMN